MSRAEDLSTFAKSLTISNNQVTLDNTNLGSSVVLGTTSSPIANNLVFADGKGMDFSSASGSNAGSSSAVLDDYEEGTYTPGFGYTGGSTGVAGTFTGRYTKIGDTVCLWGNVILTSKGSSTGEVALGGFPFTIANVNMKYPGLIGAARVNSSATVYYILEGIHNTNYAFLMAYYANTSGNKFYVLNNHISDTSFFNYQITYKSA